MQLQEWWMKTSIQSQVSFKLHAKYSMTLLFPWLNGTVWIMHLNSVCWKIHSVTLSGKNSALHKAPIVFWLQLGAQGVTLSVCLSVCPGQSALEHSIFIFQPQIHHDDFMKTSWRLKDVFRLSSGCLQDESESIRQAFGDHSEHSESTQRKLKEHSERPIRLCHTVGA